jgi:methylated-DNA-[protein]-cysteine S-methyltransferase
MGILYTVAGSPLGPLTLVADGAALIGLYLDGHLRAPRLAALGPRGRRRSCPQAVPAEP